MPKPTAILVIILVLAILSSCDKNAPSLSSETAGEHVSSQDVESSIQGPSNDIIEEKLREYWGKNLVSFVLGKAYIVDPNLGLPSGSMVFPVRASIRSLNQNGEPFPQDYYFYKNEFEEWVYLEKTRNGRFVRAHYE